jgi:hypothetical protein
MNAIIETPNAIETRNDEIKKELEIIAARKAGLNPATILAVAKNPNSSLYRYFTWDDTEAARRFREMQAYELIRRVKVTVETNDGKSLTVRAFFPVKQIEADGTIDHTKRGNYFPVTTLGQINDAIRQTIEHAKSDLKAFQTKYTALSELLEFEEVFTVIKRVK